MRGTVEVLVDHHSPHWGTRVSQGPEGSCWVRREIHGWERNGQGYIYGIVGGPGAWVPDGAWREYREAERIIN